MSLSFSVAGKPLAVNRVSTGSLPGGPVWATLDLPYSSALLTGDKVEVWDDGKPLWIGIVQSTTDYLTGQMAEITDVTAVTMAHRINPSTGKPDSHFRYGDVIRYRGLGREKYMVLTTDPENGDLLHMLSVDDGRVYRDRKDPAMWELAE